MPHIQISPGAYVTQLMSVDMLHMSSLQLTMWPGALLHILFTLFPYAHIQTCLPHNTYIYIPAFLLYSKYWQYCTYQFKKTAKCNFNPLCYFHKCARNRYAFPITCHMPKLLDMHLWKKYDNIYATYKVAPTNDVPRIAVQTTNEANDNDDWH